MLLRARLRDRVLSSGRLRAICDGESAANMAASDTAELGTGLAKGDSLGTAASAQGSHGRC